MTRQGIKGQLKKNLDGEDVATALFTTAVTATA